MEINEFLNQVVFPALATIFTTAITLYLAFKERRQAKKDKLAEEQEKAYKIDRIIATCIEGVEQMAKNEDIHGERKLEKCIEGASQMLEVEGIAISEFELRMRIEAMLSQYNGLFE